MQILVSGSLAIDRIMTFKGRFSDHIVPERIHQINLSFGVDSFNAFFGGTAGNIAYSLAMLGQEPRIVAAIGSDYRDYFTWMEDHGIPTDDIRIVEEEATASAFIVTDLADNQITGFNPGAMKHPTGFDFSSVDPANTINIVGPGNHTDMVDFGANGYAAGIYTIFDPGQSLPSWDAEGLTAAIANSHMLIANDYEMALISERTGLDDVGLLELTGVQVTTLGEQGVRISVPEGQAIVPPVKTDNVVDPTGAGDALRGGLILGLVHPVTAAHANEGGSFASITLRQLERAAQIGAACAHFAIQQPGTQEYSYTREQLDAVLERAYGG